MSLSVSDILYLQNRVSYMRDEQAYRKLFLHFHPVLFRFAFNMVKNAEQTEEIISDVMMKIWLMEAKLGQVEKLNLYLFTAVKNSAFNYLTAQKRVHTPTGLDEVNMSIPAHDNPEKRLLISEIQQLIEKAVADLPRQCQLIYRLIKEEGFAYKEVANILGVSLNTIETQMRIALKKIRMILDNYLNHTT